MSSPQHYTHTNKHLHLPEYVFPTMLHHTHTNTYICQSMSPTWLLWFLFWGWLDRSWRGHMLRRSHCYIQHKILLQNTPCQTLANKFSSRGSHCLARNQFFKHLFYHVLLHLIEVRGQSHSHCLGTISCLCHLMAFLNKVRMTTRKMKSKLVYFFK